MEKSQRVLLVLVLGFLSSAGLQAQVRRAPTAKRPETKAVLRDAPSKGVPSAGALGQRIDAILADPALSSSQVGVSVTTIEGKPLYEHNDGRLFVPASNVKLITTAAAYGLLPVETLSWTTSVAAAGEIDSAGVLHGNLVLLGVGDPTLSIRPYPYKPPPPPGSAPAPAPATNAAENGVPAVPKPVDPMLPLDLLAQQVQQDGVRSVEGDIIGDDSFFLDQSYGQNWSWGDLQWDYGAPVSALTFNDNVVFVNVLPGEHPGDKAVVTVEPETNYYELDNRVVTSSAGVPKRVGIHRDPGSKTIVLWGSLPPGDSGMKEPMSIEDPAEFVAQLFRIMLERRGITIRGKTRARHGDAEQFFDQQILHPMIPPAAGTAASSIVNPSASASTPAQPEQPDLNQSPNKVLAEHFSGPLLDDVRVTNKVSENLHAELALRLAGKLRGYGGSFEGGVAAVKQFLLQAGLKEDEFTFLDGSGLSRRDLVTPAATVQLLIYAARQPWGPAFEESLPVSGVDGSLSERFQKTPASGLIQAKTGSLSHVNALSGYGQTQAGKRFVFSIFCNNHNLPASKVLAAMDAVVKLLVGDEPRKK